MLQEVSHRDRDALQVELEQVRSNGETVLRAAKAEARSTISSLTDRLEVAERKAVSLSTLLDRSKQEVESLQVRLKTAELEHAELPAREEAMVSGQRRREELLRQELHKRDIALRKASQTSAQREKELMSKHAQHCAGLIQQQQQLASTVQQDFSYKVNPLSLITPCFIFRIHTWDMYLYIYIYIYI